MQWPEERNRLLRLNVVRLLHQRPPPALGRKHIVAPFLLVERSNPRPPIIAKEPMQYPGEIHACGHQTSKIRNQGDGRRSQECWWLMSGVGRGSRLEDGIRLTLEGKSNVQIRRQPLDGNTVLGVVEEIPLTILIPRIPCDYIEAVTGRRSLRRLRHTKRRRWIELRLRMVVLLRLRWRLGC